MEDSFFKKNELTVLITTDVHSSLSNIERMMEKMKEKQLDLALSSSLFPQNSKK